MSRIAFVKAHACGNDFLIMGIAWPREGTLCSRGSFAHGTPGWARYGTEFLDRRADGSLFLRLFKCGWQ